MGFNETALVLIPRSEDNPDDVGEVESKEQEGFAREIAKKEEEKQENLAQQLASACAEPEEMRKKMQLGVDSAATGLAVCRSSAEEKGLIQKLAARVRELEAELENKEEGLDESDKIQQIKQRVEELEELLQMKEKEAQDTSQSVERLKKRIIELEVALEQSIGESCLEEAEEAALNKFQVRVAELEAELNKSVPREQLHEVQVTLGLQLEQLARERSEIALRLNQALLDLERFCPPAQDDSDVDNNNEEQPEGLQSPRALGNECNHCFMNQKSHIGAS